MDSSGSVATAVASTSNTTTAKETSVYVGNLDDRCTESLLYELFLQVAPVQKVHIPRDRLTQVQQGYGFVDLGTPDDADYACKVMTGIKFYGRPLKVARMNQSTAGPMSLDVGANLFIGNLDGSIDERTLAETFGVFGKVITAKVGRDLDTGMPKGYGFVSFDCFESSDSALEAMHGQYLGNKPLTISYAYKKDGGRGERHGTPEERQYAQEARKQLATAATNVLFQNPSTI